MAYAQFAMMAISVLSSMKEGRDKKSGKGAEAAQFKSKSIAVKAKGTREAAEELRQGRVLQSNIRAAMAGSGGSTTDPAALEQLAKAKQVTDYNAFTAIFESEEEAKSLRLAAKMKKKEGKSGMLGGGMQGLSTMFSMFGK